MCGICGIHRFGDVPIDRVMVDLLVLHNQDRGLEAAGVALQQEDGTVQVFKNNTTAYEFIGGKGYKDFMKENLKDSTVTVLGHTRKATKGDPKNNTNNHPMFAGTTAVVHNGHITNDDYLFKDLKLEREAETDSDILRAILDSEGFNRKAVNLLTKCSGSAAFAAISPKFPGKLLLGRSGNPIELAVSNQQHLVFSSEKGPLYKAMRPYKQVYGIIMREMTPRDYYMIGMDDNSAWLFSERPREGDHNWQSNWLEWHQELKIASNFIPASYQCHAQFHGARLKFYDDRPVDIVQCPNLQECGLYLQVTQAQLKDLKNLVCGSCKTPLA